jgi:uncharacterized SAM-binding protein YcdF (DUF218 family)
MKILKRIVLGLVLAGLVVAGAAAVTYETIPSSNTAQSHFDAIIVLGYPSNPDGSPSPVERARVLAGVGEYRAGVAPRLIMTGGAAHNHYVEAEVMGRFAEDQGIPASAVVEEARARNTVQNAFYSVQIMQAHGWNSAEIVSSGSHLARASLIFAHFPIRYRTHGSTPGGFWYECVVYSREIVGTDRLRLLGFKHSPYLPGS